MNNAKCKLNGLIYSAVEFSRLISKEIEQLRRHLYCLVCNYPSFFCQTSINGRAAYFGARPHAEGCPLAAQDYFRTEDIIGNIKRSNYMPSSKTFVDLRYGVPARSNYLNPTGREPKLASDNNIIYQSTFYLYFQRPSSLLRDLIESPTFRNSDHVFIINGQEFTARNLFVYLEFATLQLSGQFRGYWGVLSDARFDINGTLWFNSVGGNNLNFCLSNNYVDEILQRYHINDLEELAGAYILVFGTPSIAQNGMLYCLISTPESVALRLI